MRKELLVTLSLLCPSSTAFAQAPSADDSLVLSRAIQAVIWGMPAVNFELMLQAALKAGARDNQIIFWSRIPDWKNQTLTPNPSTIYLMPFVDTKGTGPMVLEIPPASGGEITGTIMDAWQAALDDVGPAGADKGRGGKYLILPPGYAEKTPDGYIPLASDTNKSYALLRSNVGSGSEADVAKAVTYAKQIKLYPLSQAAAPPPTAFIDVVDATYDSTIPYDIRIFQSLDRFIQREPWLERDKAMIDQIKSIGIEKGKPFDPGPQAQATLEEAARDAHGWLDVRYEGLFKPPFYEGGQWALPVAHDVTEGLANLFAKPNVYPVDDRGAFYSFAFSSVKHLGTGQFYLVTIRDKESRALDGESTYRLTVPANAPVSLYWSGTVYDRETHGLIRGTKWSSRGSNTPGLQINPDGSADIFFGPKAPDGKESNWVPTKAGRGWEIIFRFYGPQKALFEKSWRLPDIERIAQP
ncbi:DUF1254 domain-containing protein [Bradyrhizobium cosmicum]|uniref:DUF1254 domain-containing protein n=1 Tax=Bradyrhizobium cosmicum TaxID=1404864 RepID=A0AAI8QC04_9BRAD|nr:DUF1254 domain-containing protein [Bradyrhizobium cosmicum]BAL76837.1 hypothetical protein S23_36380 [Bradyrhizobium cosmicum]